MASAAGSWAVEKSPWPLGGECRRSRWGQVTCWGWEGCGCGSKKVMDGGFGGVGGSGEGGTSGARRFGGRRRRLG